MLRWRIVSIVDGERGYWLENPRRYGAAPFGVAVIHGGPGAPGSVAPVARELSRDWGVLEPLQTVDSLHGQVDELRGLLEEHASLPVALIGHSWGAMLSFILAARHPALVRKLILVSSGVYEARYATHITETCLSRLSEAERQEAIALMEAVDDPSLQDGDTLLARLGDLLTKADTYDPITLETERLVVQLQIQQRVWADAERMRETGELLALGRHIACPVVAIHGDYDSHPPEGVRDTLAPVLKDFRFILLERCGHEPWTERYARDIFYQILRQELA